MINVNIKNKYTRIIHQGHGHTYIQGHGHIKVIRTHKTHKNAKNTSGQIKCNLPVKKIQMENKFGRRKINSVVKN